MTKGIVLFAVTLLSANCSKSSSNPGTNPPPVDPPVDTTTTTSGPAINYWLTSGDRVSLLKKQTAALAFGSAANIYPDILVDSVTQYQTVDGFGYTLTGGSAYLINHLPEADKNSLLQELFGNADNSIGVNYLRVSIGASDLSQSVFSYNDLPAGQTDENMDHFSLANDTVDLIPLLKKIVLINPNIKILGSPWSPPLWMKDNSNSMGGKLLAQYYNAYAKYFVKYVQVMQANGITVDAVTPQNEPLHGGNNPSLVMTAEEQAAFIKNSLGPAFRTAGISTKIIVYDHNCDRPDYPIAILNDADAKQYVDGSAFHLYAGDVSALSTVHNQHPDKNVYFTEQWTSSTGAFDGDLKWHVKNVIIGTMRNWSRVALEWNLANDASYGPHTTGGCTECKGALTVTTTAVTRNVSYYIVAHASKFVPAGSTRISSTNTGNLYSAAFVTPAGKKVLIVLNDGTSAAGFNIKFNNKRALASMPASSVTTFVW